MSKDPNTIYVGTKPAMSYVLAVITHFNESNTKTASLKARGRAITTAIDVVEIVRRKFMKDLKVEKLKLEPKNYNETTEQETFQQLK